MVVSTLDIYGIITVWYVLTILIGSLVTNYILWGELGRVHPGASKEDIEDLYYKFDRFKKLRNFFLVAMALTVIMWIIFLGLLFVMSIA